MPEPVSDLRKYMIDRTPPPTQEQLQDLLLDMEDWYSGWGSGIIFKLLYEALISLRNDPPLDRGVRMCSKEPAKNHQGPLNNEE